MSIIGILILVALIIFLISKVTPKHVTEIEVKEEIKTEVYQAKLTEIYLTLDNYIGQAKRIEYLNRHIEKSLRDNNPLPHIILWGSGGLGKSTLLKAVSYKMGGNFIEIVPANLRNIKDLFTILISKQCWNCENTNVYNANKCIVCGSNISVYFIPIVNVQEKDIVFLEECHGLKPEIEEAMYSLMQDGYMVVRYNGIDQRVVFPKITIAGATTQLGDLHKPFRDRFKIEIHLEPYTNEEIKTISEMYSKHKNLSLSSDVLTQISNIAFGIPRIAKKYIDDLSTFGQNISINELNKLLELLETDTNGLNKIHRQILTYINIRKQAGASSIANSVGIPLQVYMEVYEPALLYKEYIMQGSRGRILTEKARKDYLLE